MKVNMFMPEYMKEFKCISSQCIDTCCAGWDINIDENTFNKYKDSNGILKELTCDKVKGNLNDHDFFNEGFMILKEEKRCPFLNDNMLCDIHGITGEENLCITCKSYPRVYNIVDDVYEKSGIPSCDELCRKALLNKNKMEFIECEDEINEDEIEIRRIIDTEAFNGSDSLLQYFWDIRIISINIMQNREFSIEERLGMLKAFYDVLMNKYNNNDFDAVEKILDEFNHEDFDFKSIKFEPVKTKDTIYKDVIKDELVDNIKSVRLKECIKEYKNGMDQCSFSSSVIDEKCTLLNDYSYIFENYIVNQIFKDLIPFNKGNDLIESVHVLINSYKIIKTYIYGISVCKNNKLDENLIIRVIQCVSKDMEHNKVFNDLLTKDL